MRRFKRYLLALTTLLLVAAGAVMPFAVSRLQDARQAGTEVRAFDPFSLTLRQEADLGRTLRLVAGSNYYIKDAEQAEDVRMTQAEVRAAAEELMKKLIEFGLLENMAASYSWRIWPQVLCANDGSVSIPTWTFDSGMPDSLYFWLDDAAGKAFLITIPSIKHSRNYVYNVSSEPIYAAAENWRAFLEDYYGTEVHIARETWFDTTVEFALIFPLEAEEAGEQANFQLDLYIHFVDGFSSLSPYVSPDAIPPASAAYDS